MCRRMNGRAIGVITGGLLVAGFCYLSTIIVAICAGS